MCEQTRRERKKEATRINIMKTAIKLFEQQGFEQTTMNQISDEADAALGTLYNYFPSKEAIVGFYVNWVIDQYYEQIWEEVLNIPGTLERLRYILKIMAQWHVENKRLAEIYVSDLKNYCFGPNWEPIEKNRLEEIITELFARGQAEGDVNKAFEPLQMTRYLLGIVYSISMHWFAESENSSLEEKYLEGLEFFFLSCKTPKESIKTFEDLYNIFL